MNADARRCSVRLIGVHRRFPTLGGMRSLARSTWWTQSSQIGQVLYHGRDRHATKPSWHGRLLTGPYKPHSLLLVNLWPARGPKEEYGVMCGETPAVRRCQI